MVNAKNVLMFLQYRFPLTPTPYEDAARELGCSVEELLAELRRLQAEGVLKRIGFYVYYKSLGMESALVAVKAPRVDDLAEKLRAEPGVTHAYVRGPCEYNVWFTVKAPKGRLEEKIRELVDGYEYVVLPSRRIYKLSVKYDLERGVTRAPLIAPPENPPKPEELGVPANALKHLRSLPLEPRPYRGFAEALGISEEEAFEKVLELLRAGVIGDPGAALDGDKLGFQYNAMVVLRAPEPEEACKTIAEEIEEATHVVLRSAPREWPYPCYFMVHATRREPCEEIAERAAKLVGAEDYRVLYSTANLKPGVVR